MTKTTVYTSENIEQCDKDENITRKIGISDVINYIESIPEYRNSKIIQSAFLANAKTN